MQKQCVAWRIGLVEEKTKGKAMPFGID